VTSGADRSRLVQIARDAVTAHLSGAAVQSFEAFAAALRPGGAFVTFHCEGELRGCIGRIEADEPIGHVIARCAIAAATEDPRFAPISATELARLEIELSLIGPLEPIDGPHEIEIGRHGLVVERGRRRGLLLPQVAAEWRWDVETFLAQTCHKAGLPLDAWRAGALLWRFEAEVFGEPERG